MKAYWAKNALRNIMPVRRDENGNLLEFPEGSEPIKALVDLVGDDTVMEFGCGRGRLAQFFDADKYCGVDICLDAIDAALFNNPDYDFFLQDEIAYPSEEVVFAYTVLLHIPDDELSEAVEWLAQTPRIIVAEIMNPNMRNAKSMPPAFNRNVTEYDLAFKRVGYKRSCLVTVPYQAYQGINITLAEYRRDYSS